MEKKTYVTEGFWFDKMELVRTQMIPYQWQALNDRLADAEPSYCMRNYEIAGKILRGEIVRREKKENVFQPLPENGKLEDTFYGFAFQDSDFSKWIEAVAYSLEQHPDRELERIADEAIDLVCGAQREDGYLNTYFIIRNPQGIFSNLRDYHELYCFGHLTEGAVAYYCATGKDKLLRAVKKYASYIGGKFGAEEGKIPGYPGHEIAEMALARLYEVTGEQEYLRLAKYFVDERGKQPYYFDIENAARENWKGDAVENVDFAGQHMEEEKYQYNQAHRPVRQQDEAVGHAVRAVYLYSGMADVARLTGDSELAESCRRLWKNIVEKKLYITGGIGGTREGEAFSHNYDLPSDSAYAETCAAIGLVFFARRMLEIEPKREYAEVMERALYNCVLSGMSLDGKSFFYVNPLECRPQDCHKDARKSHVKPVRQKWFGCACCPPNLARLLTSIGRYISSEKDGILYLHMLMGARIEQEFTAKDGNRYSVELQIESSLPYEGKSSLTVTGLPEGERLSVALRIPEWTDTFSVDGEEHEKKEEYYFLELSPGKRVDIEFSMPVRFYQANQKVRELAGQVALVRGPLVYCLEERDNGADLHLLRVNTQGQVRIAEREIAGEAVREIVTEGYREKVSGKSSLYTSWEAPEEEAVSLHWIPYYTWANRGENEMRVWLQR